jgi:hypothetical protein
MNGFQHFTEWAKGKDFNAILACAKGNFCGLKLLGGVEEYSNNKIACTFSYYPNENWEVEPSIIEVELSPNGHLIFTDCLAKKE